MVCDHGLLDSEMIGPEGRETVVAPSFYDRLKALIETDGDLTKVYPRYPSSPRFLVDDELEQNLVKREPSVRFLSRRVSLSRSVVLTESQRSRR